MSAALKACRASAALKACRAIAAPKEKQVPRGQPVPRAIRATLVRRAALALLALLDLKDGKAK